MGMGGLNGVWAVNSLKFMTLAVNGADIPRKRMILLDYSFLTFLSV